MIAIIMGSGDWSDQTVEEIRHTFGNALVKKMYKDFSYKKVLSKGEQEIAGKKYNIENVREFYGDVCELIKQIKDTIWTEENDL